MSSPEVFRGDGSFADLFPRAAERVKIRGLLHVGAHEGEELPVYRACGVPYIALVEPDPGKALQEQLDAPDVEVLAIAIALGEPSMGAWKRSPNTHQSQLTHQDTGVWVRTMPLSQVLDVIRDVNVLVVDTSGSELDVLSSGPLDRFDLIIVETDDQAFYASETGQVRALLAGQGFRSVERWTHGAHSYGDEVFVRA